MYGANDVAGAENDSTKLGEVFDAETDANNSFTFVWTGSVLWWKSCNVCVAVDVTDVGSLLVVLAVWSNVTWETPAVISVTDCVWGVWGASGIFGTKVKGGAYGNIGLAGTDGTGFVCCNCKY